MPRWNYFTENVLSRVTTELKRKRVELFVDYLGLKAKDIILDLGSEDGGYLAEFYPWPHNIVLADIVEEPMRRGVDRYGLRGYILLPGTGRMPIAEQDFDAGWCNSAIEHVIPDRSQASTLRSPEFAGRANARQLEFAREVRRVSKAYFVQTPYVHFPIEAHSWLPGIQYLSQQQRHKLSRWLKPVWIKQWGANFYLYDRRRFSEHFPDATSIYLERVCGVVKSLIAIRRR